jgi:single-stranded-DNA-specific exonuclease
VVFGLTPRINAAGRLGEAQLALDLLLAEDHAAAAGLAQKLDQINQERRAEEQIIFAEALAQALETPERPSFVLFGENWHPGIIGIVASRIAEHFYRPTLVLCRKGETLKGSGRSIPEFDLHAGLQACSDLLLAFGGHRQAAGMSIVPENLPQLAERFDAVVRESFEQLPTPGVLADARLSFAQSMDPLLHKELELLQPFGPGNAEPIFVASPLLLRTIRYFGPRSEHAELELTDESCSITLRAKAWRRSEEFPKSLGGSRIHLAFTLRMDRYRGPGEVELLLKAWEPVA